MKLLAAYRQAQEFSHFGSELALAVKKDLEAGKRIHAVLNQPPGESYSTMSQQLMLDIAINVQEGEVLDINAMKLAANDIAKLIQKDEDYEKVRDELKTKSLLELKK